MTWKWWFYSGEVVKNVYFWNIPSGVIVFPNSLSFCKGWDSLRCAVRTCDHEGIRISITITNIPTSPSSGSSSRSHQQPQQKWQAHTNVVLLFGLYYCHDSPEHQVSSKSTFCELRLVAAHFMSQRGFIVFSNVFIRLIVLSWMGQAFTNKVLNQTVKYISIYSLLPQVLRCSSNYQSSTAFRRGTGCNRPITFWWPLPFARS